MEKTCLKLKIETQSSIPPKPYDKTIYWRINGWLALEIDHLLQFHWQEIFQAVEFWQQDMHVREVTQVLL